MALLADVELAPRHWAVILVAIFLIYLVALAVYRLYLSPLAKFPGPKIAALTQYYEVYHDVWRWGQYTFEIKKMHEKYGPIVRISPNELHVSDPHFYQELYSRSSPRDKYSYLTGAMNVHLSTFATNSHAHHRVRRAALNPFFSKQKIAGLEHAISSKVEKLCKRLEEYRSSGDVLPLRLLYMAQTTDVVTQYCFARSWGHLDKPDLSAAWYRTVKAIAEIGVVFKNCRWMFAVAEALPQRLAAALDPGLVSIFELQRDLEKQIKEVIEDQGNREKYLIDGQPTVFHQLLSSGLPPEELTVERLWHEGEIIVGAGAETTANTLTTITFYLLDNPDKLEKLREELKTVIPDPDVLPKLQVLEQLPYLSAVISEGLRLSYGVSSRLQRIAPNQTLNFLEWSIPPGTPVGMTSVLMHHDESIFPYSHSFLPERWLAPQDPHKSPLDRYLVSFSKGSRQCVGMNLARAQIYLTLAAVFSRFEMRLFETSLSDIEIKRDLFLPQPDDGSKGVRVLVV